MLDTYTEMFLSVWSETFNLEADGGHCVALAVLILSLLAQRSRYRFC